MTFTVSSNSFKDGDYLGKDFILSADFGFGCAGGNKSPHLKWSGAPEGTQSLRGDLLRSRRADRLGLLALAGGEHPDQCDGACARRRQRRRQAADGRAADAHRFRRARLWRPVPAGGRPSAPLSVHGVRGGRREPAGRRPTPAPRWSASTCISPRWRRRRSWDCSSGEDGADRAAHAPNATHAPWPARPGNMAIARPATHWT